MIVKVSMQQNISYTSEITNICDRDPRTGKNTKDTTYNGIL